MFILLGWVSLAKAALWNTASYLHLSVTNGVLSWEQGLIKGGEERRAYKVTESLAEKGQMKHRQQAPNPNPAFRFDQGPAQRALGSVYATWGLDMVYKYFLNG